MSETVTITRARHAWQEDKGFTINRPRGIKEYTFLRFHTPVLLMLNGEVLSAPADSCVFYNVDTPQWFQSPGVLTHDWMHMVGPVPESLGSAGLEMDKLYLPGNGQFVTAIIREIEFELLANPNENSSLAELKYRELLLKLAREVKRETMEVPLKSSVKAQLRACRSHVFAHLDESWTVEKMAKLAYMSGSRFHTLYRTAFGISPVDDLIHARIDTAKNRLCNSEESVNDLAASLGYRNVTHFCRQFKKITGLTPIQFRKSQEE